MDNFFDSSEIVLFNVPVELIKLAEINPSEAEAQINEFQEKVTTSTILNAFRRSISKSHPRSKSSASKSLDKAPSLTPLSSSHVDSDSDSNSDSLSLRGSAPMPRSDPKTVDLSDSSDPESGDDCDSDVERNPRKKSREPAKMDSKDSKKRPATRIVIVTSESDSDDEIQDLDFLGSVSDDDTADGITKNSKKATSKGSKSQITDSSKAPEPVVSSGDDSSEAKTDRTTSKSEEKSSGQGSSKSNGLLLPETLDCIDDSSASTSSLKVLNAKSESKSANGKDNGDEKASKIKNNDDDSTDVSGSERVGKSSNAKDVDSSDSSNLPDLSDSEKKVPEKKDSKEKKEKEEKKDNLKENKKDQSSKTNESGTNGKKRGRKVAHASSGSDDEDKSSKSKKKRRRVRYFEDDDEELSDDDDSIKQIKDKKSDTSDDEKSTEKDKGFRKRKILRLDQVRKETRIASQEENERRKRIQERQALYNELTAQLVSDSSGNNESRVILEFDAKSKEPLVEVNSILAPQLKKHQVEGIQFMYAATIESQEELRKEDSGSGCILAHSMGLGKTLQVITYVHTLLTHKLTRKYIKRALVICPKNTVKNWAAEFRYWLYDNNLTDFLTTDFEDFDGPRARTQALEEFAEQGGVLIINTSIFPKLIHSAMKPDPKAKSKGKAKKPAKNSNTKFSQMIREALIDGPDLVIVDEGHLIKSDKTKLNISVNKIKTRRRIILTGTPLQNNLTEYYHMVNFVKPCLLGTHKEFKNRFKNPIDNGQMEDSAPEEVRTMKRRVHILHRLLQHCVHRRDYTVLAPYLKPKLEYVLKVRLSEVQINMYREYLENHSQKSARENDAGKTCGHRQYLFKDCNVLRWLVAHPYILRHAARRDAARDEVDSLEDFIADDSESFDSEASLQAPDVDDAPKTKRLTRSAKEEGLGSLEGPISPSLLENAWFESFIPENQREESIEIGSKICLLFHILHICEKIGDKLLVFSQSLDTLNMIEDFLELVSGKPEILSTMTGDDTVSDVQSTWRRDVDYFRLDGSSKSDVRKTLITRFNDPDNLRARLFLISTKAGSLGINLIGANRCVIFDSSWNPAHDVQAIFRIYRFGQNKPVYIYRLVSHGTMEQRIYERQIIKQALSRRVVDDQEIVRHFKENEIAELYKFEPIPEEEKTPAVPKDRLLADILVAEKSRNLIVEYHLQDSLLENRPEEELPDDEKEDAWEQYAADRKREEEEERKRQADLEYRAQIVAEQARRMQIAGTCFPIYDELRGNTLFAGIDDLRKFMLQKCAERIASYQQLLPSASGNEATLLNEKIRHFSLARENWPIFENSFVMTKKPWKPALPLNIPRSMGQSLIRPPTLPGPSSAPPQPPTMNESNLLHTLSSQPDLALINQQLQNLPPDQFNALNNILQIYSQSQPN